MMPKPYAYYNEFDPEKAAWLQNLMNAGAIAPGAIDTRSITDVKASDLMGYSQHHFFAGIGVWSSALRRAGWPDDRYACTFSCPCPPFSTAGSGQTCPNCGGGSHLCHPKRTGYFICLDCGHCHFADERHLYPEVSRIVGELAPAVCFGEQVASIDGRTWLAAVRADMENMGYAVGGTDLCSAGVGAPNIRQRLYFVAKRLADTDSIGQQGQRLMGRPMHTAQGKPWEVNRAIDDCRSRGLADSNSEQLYRSRIGGSSGRNEHTDCCTDDWLGDTDSIVEEEVGSVRYGPDTTAGRSSDNGLPRPPEIGWDAADWLYCTDGKWRPVEPGTFPLASGPSGDLGRVYTRWRRIGLKGYGDGLNLEVATTFIKSSMPLLQSID
ncbi:DNA cytosine methyltransferase [Sulfurimonas sp. HSL1-6]|uniref:DNA cytosine methyltransferase n=1 Tax=Thiomicrolovo immobilis TaxID=3131935 RepID=UPI0031F849BD